MGFIPIIVTVSGACLLFIIVVGNNFATRIKFMVQQQYLIAAGFRNLGLNVPSSLEETLDFQATEQAVREGIQTLAGSKSEEFKKAILIHFQSYKIAKVQYNLLLTKKPYSFVAKIRGFQMI
jgi:hypothetical protein